MTLTFSKLATVLFMVAMLCLTGCSGSSLTSLGNSSSLGPSGTACTPKSDPNAFDQTQKTWICKWQKPAGASTAALTYIGHVDNDLAKLWDTTSFSTPNTSQEVTVPTSGGPWLFAVSAQKGTKVYHDYNYVILQEEGAGNVVAFDGIKDLAAASRDYYTARWDVCKSKTTGAALSCVYSVYRVVGGDSRQLFLVGTTVDLSMRIQTSAQGGEQFMVRARETGQNDSNTILLSDLLKVGTGYPAFEGLKLAKVSPGIAGLHEGLLSWNAVEDISTIKGYQIFHSLTRGLPATASQLTNPAPWPFVQFTSANLLSAVPLVNGGTLGTLIAPTETTVTVNGLVEDTLHYFVVRAVNSAGTLAEAGRGDPSFSTKKFEITQGFAGITHLNRATGTNFEAFSNLDVGIGAVDTNAPGVHDSFLVTYEQVTTCAQPFSASALTEVIGDSAATQVRISSLSNGLLYKAMVQARLAPLNVNDPALLSNTPSYLCQTVGANPPVFTGLTNAVPDLGPPMTAGFTKMSISFNPATGHNGYKVTATPDATNSASLNCVTRSQEYGDTSASPVIVTSLVPTCLYRFQMVAYYRCAPPGCPGTYYLESGDTSPSSGIQKATIPAWPDGNASNIIINSETSASITFSTPRALGATFDRFAVYKSIGPTAVDDLMNPNTGRVILRQPPNAIINYPQALNGTSYPSSMTWPDPETIPSPVQVCYVIQPYLNANGFPTVWSKTPPTPICKYFQVLAMDSWQGITSVRRKATPEGFSKVEIKYRKVTEDDSGYLNHEAFEFYCTYDELIRHDCYQYDNIDDPTSPCPSTDKLWIKRIPKEILPSGSPVTYGYVDLANSAAVGNIPPHRAISCWGATINTRGAVNVFNRGNGAGYSFEPVIKTTLPEPVPPGGNGMLTVAAATSQSLRVSVELPKATIDSVGGGLFSHVLLAVDRSPVTTIQSVIGLFDNLTSAGGKRTQFSFPSFGLNLNVISLLRTDLSSTGLFANPTYDMGGTGATVDGTQYTFNPMDTNQKVMLRFNFKSDAQSNQQLMSASANNTVDFILDGLTSNQKVCVLARAVYMDDTYPRSGTIDTHYLQNDTTTASNLCDTPKASPPLFPNANDFSDATNPLGAGAIFETISGQEGYSKKPTVSGPGTITEQFDKWRYDLPGVAAVSMAECHNIQVALFSSPQVQAEGESDNAYADRLFAPNLPYAQGELPCDAAHPRASVPGRVELRTLNCTINPQTGFFQVGVDTDSPPDCVAPQRYGKYYIIARAYTEGSSNLSRGQLKQGRDGAFSYLMPNSPGPTNINPVVLNDPNLPACDGTNFVTNCYDATNVPMRNLGEKFTAKISVTAPPEADGPYPKYLNKVYVWRSTATDQTSARLAVANRAQTKPDRSGPNSAPDVIIDRTTQMVIVGNAAPVAGGSLYAESSGTFTYLDAGVSAGDSRNLYTCYASLVVYQDSFDVTGRYLAGPRSANNPNGFSPAAESTQVRCVNPSYSAPSPSFGVPNLGGINASGTCGTGLDSNADGTAKIRLSLSPGTITGDYDYIYIFYSPTPPPSSLQPDVDTTFAVTGTPWAIVPKAHSYFDPDAGTTGYTYTGCAGKTVASGYFHVRTSYGPATGLSVNNKYNTSAYSINSNQANYVYISKNATKLSYSFFMMSMEAVLVGTPGTHTISTDPNDMKTCNSAFHDFTNPGGFVAANNNCGTFGSLGTAVSQPNVTPSNVKWSQAWAACRNTSTNKFRLRLPTQEEWRRATQYAADAYSTSASSTTLYPSSGCNFSGSVHLTGSNFACRSNLTQAVDAAGNMKEWVDARMVEQDLSAWKRSIAGGSVYVDNYNIVGRMVDNGIDRLTPMFHRVDPGFYFSALLMGSGFSSASPFTQQKDVNTQTWVDQDSGATLPADAGFRCVAFSDQTPIPALGLELPQESRYTHDAATPSQGDTPGPGSVKNWTVPKNRYLRTTGDNWGDYRFEQITIPTNPSIAGGPITISWAPWEKSCNATTSCQNNFKYYVYRMQEPVGKDERLNPSWSVTGSRYTTPKPLDPLAMNSDGVTPAWSPRPGSPILGSACTLSKPYKCSFTETILPADATTSWIYVIVAEDDVGNRMTPIVQRFRSPHLTGEPLAPVALALRSPSFRMEPRLRRVSLVLLDNSYLPKARPTHRLSWVPMHQSGLDHDFFVSAYEVSLYAGSPDAVDTDGPQSNYAGTNVWRSNAATCYEKFLRTGTIDATVCQNGGANVVFNSVPSATAVPLKYGSWVRGCLNTTATDAETSPNDYRMRPVTTAELNMASDWGDLNFDGIADRNDYLGSGIENTSWHAYEGDPSKCNNSGTILPTGSFTTCRSMYGVYDAVSNMYELGADKYYHSYGLDNGIDGLGLGGGPVSATEQKGFFLPPGSTGLWDLTMLVPTATNGAPITLNPAVRFDNYSAGTDAISPSVLGGSGVSGAIYNSAFFQFYLYTDYANAAIGGRCAF